MSSPVFFSDFGKACSGIFDHDGKKNKYDTRHRLKIKSALSKPSHKFDFSAYHQGEQVDLELKDTFKCDKYGTFDIKLPTNKDMQVEFKNTELVKNLQLTFRFKGDRTAKLSTKYSKEMAAFTADVESGAGGDISIKPSLAFAYNKFRIGGDLCFKPADKDGLSNYGLGLEYAIGKSTIFTLKSTKRTDVYTGMVSHQFSPSTLLAAEFKYDVANEKKLASVAADYKIDSDMSVIGKITSAGIAKAVWTSRLNSSAKLALTGTMDIKQLDKATPDIGVGLIFGD